MRYQLAPIYCRPWLLLGLSPKAGFDARYMKGGHSAWKAAGGQTRSHAPS